MIVQKETLTEQEKLDLIRIVRSKNIGVRTFYKLINTYHSPTKALRNVHNFPYNFEYRNIKICSEESALEEIENCKKINAEIITIYDNNYPKRLREIDDPPPILTVRGNIELLSKNIIAMIGARNASYHGCHYAQNLARELGENNLVIASGLARGIDTASHIGSLKTGTIAVIAGGIDNIYPPENHRLYEEIIKNGVIISELPFGTAPKSSNFPQRNRIISGISLGVVVVEASLKSGTLITTKFAAEQGREVFAVPGHPADPKSEGTLKLISDGATPLYSYKDVLREIDFIINTKIEQYGKTIEKTKKVKFNPRLKTDDSYKNYKDNFENKLSNNTKNDKNGNENEKIRNILLEKIGIVPIFVEELIESLNENVQNINSALMEMELEGIIQIKNGKVERKACYISYDHSN